MCELKDDIIFLKNKDDADITIIISSNLNGALNPIRLFYKFESVIKMREYYIHWIILEFHAWSDTNFPLKVGKVSFAINGRLT